MRLLVTATVLTLAVQAGTALASDMDTLPPPPLAPTIVPDQVGGWYGNVHVGAAMDSFSIPTQIVVPYGNIGGKIAYDGGAGNFGFQVDGDVDYGDLSIVSPSPNGLSGNYSTVNGAAHLTYMLNDNVKFGVFAGVSTAGFSASYPPGYSIPALSANPIISGNATLGLLGAGLEALAVLDNNTTLQARLAFLDPSFLSYTYNDGTTPVSATSFDVTAGYGFSVSASASRHFGQHFLARVDGSYANVTAGYLGVSGNVSEVTGAVTGQYSLSSLPMSLGATAGLSSMSAAGYSSMGYMLGVKATYSFGGSGHGAEGHLFNSGIFNALF